MLHLAQDITDELVFNMCLGHHIGQLDHVFLSSPSNTHKLLCSWLQRTSGRDTQGNMPPTSSLEASSQKCPDRQELECKDNKKQVFHQGSGLKVLDFICLVVEKSTVFSSTDSNGLRRVSIYLG